MKKLDETDKTPTVLSDDKNIVFESLSLLGGERAEIVLAPMQAVRGGRLFLASIPKESKIVIEQIFHGRAGIFPRETLTFDTFLHGREIDFTISDSEPLKIVIKNVGVVRTVISASLASDIPKGDTTYRLTGDQIVRQKDK